MGGGVATRNTGPYVYIYIYFYMHTTRRKRYRALHGSLQTPVERRLSSWKGPFCTSMLVGGRVVFLQLLHIHTHTHKPTRRKKYIVHDTIFFLLVCVCVCVCSWRWNCVWRCLVSFFHGQSRPLRRLKGDNALQSDWWTWIKHRASMMGPTTLESIPSQDPQPSLRIRQRATHWEVRPSEDQLLLHQRKNHMGVAQNKRARGYAGSSFLVSIYHEAILGTSF